MYAPRSDFMYDDHTKSISLYNLLMHNCLLAHNVYSICMIYVYEKVTIGLRKRLGCVWRYNSYA